MTPAVTYCVSRPHVPRARPQSMPFQTLSLLLCDILSRLKAGGVKISCPNSETGQENRQIIG